MNKEKKKKLSKPFRYKGDKLYKYLERIGYPSLVKILKLLDIKEI